MQTLYTNSHGTFRTVIAILSLLLYAVLQRRRGLTKYRGEGGAESCNFPTDSCKFPTKEITCAHFNFYPKFPPRPQIMGF